MPYTSSISPYWIVGLIATAWLVRKKLVPLYVTPLLSLRGPPSPSILYGNFQQLGKVADPTLAQKWIEDYGSTFLARVFLMVRDCPLTLFYSTTMMIAYPGIVLSCHACGPPTPMP